MFMIGVLSLKKSLKKRFRVIHISFWNAMNKSSSGLRCSHDKSQRVEGHKFVSRRPGTKMVMKELLLRKFAA